MAITLNHTIVPTRDKQASAEFFANIFGLKVERGVGHFAAVRVNDTLRGVGHFAAVRVNDTLTLDFADSEEFESHHYAFHVSDEEFEAIFARVKDKGIEYSSDPMHHNKGEINHRKQGRGFYFYDPNGHNLELMTRV